eukprot:jgi/Undpi1/432/HiC_scaffold_1.g00428.m1
MFGFVADVIAIAAEQTVQALQQGVEEVAQVGARVLGETTTFIVEKIAEGMASIAWTLGFGEPRSTVPTCGHHAAGLVAFGLMMSELDGGNSLFSRYAIMLNAALMNAAATATMAAAEPSP